MFQPFFISLRSQGSHPLPVLHTPSNKYPACNCIFFLDNAQYLYTQQERIIQTILQYVLRILKNGLKTQKNYAFFIDYQKLKIESEFYCLTVQIKHVLAKYFLVSWIFACFFCFIGLCQDGVLPQEIKLAQTWSSK